jgi:hypothetical protein
MITAWTGQQDSDQVAPVILSNTHSYLHCELEKQAALLEKLGKHKIGKSCLYIKKFEDVHVPTLKKLIMKAYKSPAIAGATID